MQSQEQAGSSVCEGCTRAEADALWQGAVCWGVKMELSRIWWQLNEARMASAAAYHATLKYYQITSKTRVKVLQNL